ncbi:MAG: hypothetical protein GY950_03170, partial [bacterium]|nr:hypothetical protein [bacterium]
DNNIQSIREDSHGNLWVATGRALHRLKKEQDGRVTIHKRHDIGMLPVIFEDREKSLWIGTFRFGLKRLRDGIIKTLFKEQGIPPYKLVLYKDRGGVIWLGSVFGNLFRYTGGACRPFLQSGNINMEITAISEDKDGNPWFGTKSRGLFQVTGKRAVNKYTAGTNRADFPITVIFRDNRDKLRVGTGGGGMLSYENGSFTTITVKDGLSGNRVNNIYQDRDNHTWIGTNSGIDILENGRWDPATKRTFLTGHNIFAIHQDRRRSGIFWLGTYNSGLARLNVNTGKTVFYTAGDGMPTGIVFQVLEDSRENFWLSSPDGIIKVAKKELEDFAGRRTGKITSTLFGLPDGMLNVQCTMSARNSAVKAGVDEFWFATQKGISVVKPGKITINKYPPGAVIEKILFNGEPIPVPQNMPAKSFKGIKNARFYFTAPTFISPEKVNVLYKLEGLEQEWNTIEPFHARTAYYNNLPPGNYRFRVTAVNSDGIRNTKGTSFSFTLKQHVYETNWFKIVSLLLVLSAAAAAFYGLKKYLYLRELKNKYK